jgi:hypothetical protein
LATSGVGRASLAEGRTHGSAGGTGAWGADLPSAAAFLRPSILASRRSGESSVGGVEGVAIPGMGPRVAAVGTEPADEEVGALRGSAPARSTTVGWPPTDSLGPVGSPTESGSFPVAWDTPAGATLGRVSATPAGPAAGGSSAFTGLASTFADASAFTGFASTLAAGGATGASGAAPIFGTGAAAFAGWASTLAAGGTAASAAWTSG